MKPALRPRRGPTGRATPATSASSWAAPPRGPAPLASASAVSVNIWILNWIQMANSLINSQLYVWGHNECERDIFPESGIFINIQRVNSDQGKFKEIHWLSDTLEWARVDWQLTNWTTGSVNCGKIIFHLQNKHWIFIQTWLCQLRAGPARGDRQ